MFTTLLRPPLAVIALALAVLGQPAAAATFTVGALSAGDSAVGGCSGGGQSSGSNPVSISRVCSDLFGVTSASASSGFGHLGARAAGVSSRVLSAGSSGLAIFSDTLTFTSSNPLATFADVSLNMALDGVLNSSANAAISAHAAATLDGHIAIAGRFFQFLFSNDTVQGFIILNALDLTAGVIGPITDAQLRTPTFRVDLNAPVFFEMSFGAGAVGLGSGASANTDFSGSFKFPTVGDVFNLPNGVTVNAGDYLVNNHFIDPLAVSVPEPASWALMIAGLGMAGVALRRRRGR